MHDFSEEEVEVTELPEREEMFLLNIDVLGLLGVKLDTNAPS